MTRKRRQLRPRPDAMAGVYAACKTNGFPAQRPFTAEEVPYLLSKIEQIKAGRKYLARHVKDDAKRKALQRLENGFVTEFFDRNIYNRYKVNDGPFITFEKVGTGYWRPIFT